MRDAGNESGHGFARERGLKIKTGKLFLDALAGHVGERVPFWFMRQAGRYLPEYRALRSEKGGFLEMAYDPDTACEITMQPIRRFGMDAAIIFSDILVVPHALGQSLEFAAGEGPKLNPVRDGKALAALNFHNFEKKLAPVFEAIRKTKAQLQAENFKQTALIGFAGAPWTVATYMIEGGSSRDFIHAKKMAYGDPETFAELMHLLTEATAAYLIKQADAGAEALKIFDSWAGVLDENLFQKWVIGPAREIVRQVRAVHPHIPLIGFPRGAGENYFSYVQNSGMSAVALDQFVPTRWATRVLQTHMPVQGNLDPVCLMTGGDAMALSVERIMSELSKAPFIFNLGHGVHKETPVEHVATLSDMLKNWKL
jgi:uroporphyrinogen decarboxylase